MIDIVNRIIDRCCNQLVKRQSVNHHGKEKANFVASSQNDPSTCKAGLFHTIAEADSDLVSNRDVDILVNCYLAVLQLV